MAKSPMKMDTKSVLARAERVQKLEAGENRLAKAMPAKNKPVTPTMSTAARAATQATLSRAERVQREEARGDALLMKKKPAPAVIKTTVSYRPSPMKKK